MQGHTNERTEEKDTGFPLKTAGMTEGDRSGMTEGDRSGMTEGDRPGMTEGDRPGMTEGIGRE